MPIFREPLPGILIEFGSDPKLPLSAFLVGNYNRIVISVGGQLDGFFSLPFVRPLAKELQAKEWSLVLPRFASSFLGNRESHISDATDLKQLVDILVNKFEATEICLMGWDTGVQIVLEYLSSFRSDQTDSVTRIILNGAVADHLNDHFCNAGQHLRKEFVEKAITENRRHELLPAKYYDKDITVGRMTCGGYPTVQEAVWNPARCGDAAALREALRDVSTPLLIQVLPTPGLKVSEEERADIDHFVSSNAASTEVYVDFIDDSSDERREVLQGSEAQHIGSILTFLESADKRRLERIEAQKVEEYTTDRKQRSILHNSDLAYSQKN